MSRRNPNNSIVSKIANRIDPVTKAQTSTKMHIACLIDDAMDKFELSPRYLAINLRVEEYEVHSWLSGTHNFTVDELVKISLHLDIDLVTMYKED